MRFFAFLFLLIGVSAIGTAQENSKKTKAPKGSGLTLPESTLPSPPSNVLGNTSSLFNKSMPSAGSIPEKELNLGFGTQKQFANPSAGIEKKLNSQILTGAPIFADSNRNKYLGDIKAHSGSIRLYCRDDGSVDGDQIKVFVNGKVVAEMITLQGDFKGITIDLQSGFNKIEFEALNEGSQSPNTAQFQVFDGDGKMIHDSSWQLNTGYVGTVIVVK